MTELGLRNDVYRRPLATALERLQLAPGWRCVDVGAGGGDVTVALAELVGREGRVYAVDNDPSALHALWTLAQLGRFDRNAAGIAPLAQSLSHHAPSM